MKLHFLDVSPQIFQLLVLFISPCPFLFSFFNLFLSFPSFLLDAFLINFPSLILSN